jgi:hypothetical protein
MTSAPAPSSPSAGAARREPVDRLHRATQVVLVVGSVLALAAAAGPVWVVRAGVVVAVATTVVTTLLAWRELAGARRRHAHRQLVSDKRHGDALRSERTRNAEVVDALGERLRSTGMVVAGQRSQIAQLRGEVGVLTTERDALRDQVAERDGLLGIFRLSLREQEAALVEARTNERTNDWAQTAAPAPEVAEVAEVHALPRRSRPNADEVLDPQMAELAMVLPNYEGARRAV